MTYLDFRYDKHFEVGFQVNSGEIPVFVTSSRQIQALTLRFTVRLQDLNLSIAAGRQSGDPCFASTETPLTVCNLELHNQCEVWYQIYL